MSSISCAAASSSASVPTGRRVLVHTFKGLTWRRFGIFCIFIAVMALGYTVPHLLVGGKSMSEFAPNVFSKFRGYVVPFLPVLLTVIAIDNWVPKDRRTLALALGIGLSAVVGIELSFALGNIIDDGHFLAPWRKQTLADTFGWWLNNCFLAAMATAAYYFAARENEVHTTLHQEQMERLGLEREMTEAKLQVMQAQIEPHFLFNTLANVRRLYQTDPPTGRAMLRHLSRYLSAALPQMRESQSTLGRELALTIAYLNVQKIRMGERLSFEVDVPEALEPCTVPPMMLLTLVENAIRHGLVPLPKGGRVQVSARADDGTLRLQVADTGRGLHESSGAGIGLANIRSRLRTLYDADARLLLAQNLELGVTATLELPVAMSGEAKAA